MVWHILKYWASFFIPAFYRRIQGKNLHQLRTADPVIIAMNHPNAFTDPILITYLMYPLRLKYMARGDAFRPGPAAWLLEQIGLVPIFRIQDAGREGLKRNDASYRRVNALLKKNCKVIVFAEGLCIQERRLRPIKKGVARMVFGAYDFLGHDRLKVIPVGVNYSHPNKFRSDVFYNVGEPLFVKDYIREYRQQPARAQKRFLQTLEPAMRSLITHINNPADDEVVYKMEEMVKHDRIVAAGLDPRNLEHDFQVLSELTGQVNRASVNEPGLVATFSEKAGRYFKLLREHGFKDWTINPLRNNSIKPRYVFFRGLALLAVLPLYLAGMAANFPPLFATAAITGKLVKNREFYSSFALGFGMLIFPLFYLVWFFLLYSISPNVLWPVAICAFLALCAGFCLLYHPFLRKTLLMFRCLRKKPVVSELSAMRAELMTLINKF